MLFKSQRWSITQKIPLSLPVFTLRHIKINMIKPLQNLLFFCFGIVSACIHYTYWSFFFHIKNWNNASNNFSILRITFKLKYFLYFNIIIVKLPFWWMFIEHLINTNWKYQLYYSMFNHTFHVFVSIIVEKLARRKLTSKP